MLTKFHLGLVGAAALLAAAPAYAQQESSGFQAGVTAGSLGVGPEVGFRASPLFGIRASASFLDVSHDFDVDDIN